MTGGRIAAAALIVGWLALLVAAPFLALLAAPCLLVAVPLALGRYVGERGLHRLAARVAARRRRPVAVLSPVRWAPLRTLLGPASRLGGVFLTRGPPAVATA